jgi:bacteriocin-like protein
MSVEKPSQESSPQEISETELQKVSGGTDSKPTPPTTTTKHGIGSQSSGAGAGKITFNPFSIT